MANAKFEGIRYFKSLSEELGLRGRVICGPAALKYLSPRASMEAVGYVSPAAHKHNGSPRL